MLVQPGCYKCILDLCSELVQEAADSLPERNRRLREYLHTFMTRMDDHTPPELANFLFAQHRQNTGVDDPFLEKKRASTELARQLLPEFAAEVARSADPFLSALRFAIGGNVIDYGATPDFRLGTAAAAIRQAAELPLDLAAAADLRQRAQHAKTVLYILDNCGEAVFDRLLIDRIGPEKVTLGVRGGPIINDITRAELAASGLDDLPVLDTGVRAPGVSLKLSSPEFLAAARAADLVIAKGQGNFESLWGAPGFDHVFFLFRVKCPVLETFAGVKLHSLQVLTSFLAGKEVRQEKAVTLLSFQRK